MTLVFYFTIKEKNLRSWSVCEEVVLFSFFNSFGNEIWGN